MKEYTLGIKVLIAVEVPDSANGFVIAQAGTYGKNGKLYPACVGFYSDYSQDTWDEIEFSPGSYSILARGREVTEEQWEQLFPEGVQHIYAKESGNHWMKEQGISPDCLLIIKK